MNEFCKALLCGILLLTQNKAIAQPDFFSKSFGVLNNLDLAKGLVVSSDDSTFYVLAASGGSGPPIGLYMIRSDQYGNIIDSFFFSRPGTNQLNLYQELWGSLKWLNDSIMLSGGAMTNASIPYGVGSLYFFNKQLDTIAIKSYGNDLENIGYRAMLLPGKKIAIGGNAAISTTNLQAWVVLTDSNGNQIWDKNYGGAEENLAWEVLPFPSNRYLVCAGKKTSGEYHPWLLVLDSAGNLLYTKEFNTPAYRWDMAAGMLLHDGSYLLESNMDTVINTGDEPHPSYMMKIDTNFNILWRHIFNSPAFNEIAKPIELIDGSIVQGGIAGDVHSNSFGWLTKLDSSGNLLWEHYYSFDSDSSWNGFYDIQQVWDGGFIMSGTTDALYGSAQNQDAWLVRVDSNGCLVPGCFTAVPPIEVEPTLSWNIFPNPAASETEIAYNLPPQMRNAVLQVININGQVMKQITLSNREHLLTLSINDIPTGIYLVRLQTGSGVSEIKKLIVAR